MAIDFERLGAKKPKYEEGKTYTYEEYFPMVKADIDNRINYCFDLLMEGREEDAAEIIEYHIGNNHIEGYYSSQDVLCMLCGYFDNEKILFNLILNVYMMDGYFFPRKLIQLAKRLSKDIPENERLSGLPDGNPITVYRGSYTPIQLMSKIKAEPSWTTDRNEAIWFAYRDYRRAAENNDYRPPAFVYQAEIPREKIIAYLTDRNESEVLQHCNVRNITALDITESEVDEAFRIHEEGCQKAIDEVMNG